MPPIITAAIMSEAPAAAVRVAVPNTYAALLNGPPMSIAIMPASTMPSSTLLTSPIELRPLKMALFSQPTNGFIAHITTAIKIIPSSG